VRLDQYLAVAYFQQGVSNFLVGDFEEALANFNDTLLYLRGNNMIDYAQLGLMFKLYSCEVLFNRGLCYIYLQQKEAGMQDFSFAVKEKVVEDHNVIDEAIREEAEVRYGTQDVGATWLTYFFRDTPFSQYQLAWYIDQIRQRSRT
jgi:tetratricopeptide (TPR) repeat protein